MSDGPDRPEGMPLPPRHLAPAVIESARSGPGTTGRAAFISQLLAERHHLPPQRERRRAPVEVAISSYDAALRQAIRRLPPGYRRNLSA